MFKSIYVLRVGTYFNNITKCKINRQKQCLIYSHCKCKFCIFVKGTVNLSIVTLRTRIPVTRKIYFRRFIS